MKEREGRDGVKMRRKSRRTLRRVKQERERVSLSLNSRVQLQRVVYDCSVK